MNAPSRRWMRNRRRGSAHLAHLVDGGGLRSYCGVSTDGWVVLDSLEVEAVVLCIRCERVDDAPELAEHAAAIAARGSR